MTEILIKLFIGKDADSKSPEIRKKYGFLSGCIGIVLNILLFAGKLAAGIVSGAISVVADALNNLSDAGSSVVNMVGFKISISPPDMEHPFGHGRAEYISGLIISFVIAVMGVELAKSSVEKIVCPEPPEFNLFTFIMLAVSVLAKLWLFLFYRRLGIKINSVSMKAAAADSISDVLATAAVILGVVVGFTANANIDGYIGLLVSLFIIFSGIKTAKESLSPLLGQMPDKEFAQSIKNTVCSYKGIIGIHDLMIHNYGVDKSIISLHAEVPSNASLLDAHSLIDRIETDLKHKFNCEATIHIDPIDINDAETAGLYKRVAAMVRAIDGRLSIHDFRLVKNPAGNSIIFDLVIPYDFRLTAQQTKESVIMGISAIDEKAVPVISVDRQMTELD